MFIKTLEYYINALLFDSKKVLAGLDEEIKAINKESENIIQPRKNESIILKSICTEKIMC